MELLDKAKELRQARQAERLAAVEDLARRQAIGEPISPEDLVEACELAGVDLEKDFSDRVADRLKRIGLRAGSCAASRGSAAAGPGGGGYGGGTCKTRGGTIARQPRKTHRLGMLFRRQVSG